MVVQKHSNPCLLEGKQVKNNNKNMEEEAEMMIMDPAELLPQHQALLPHGNKKLGDGTQWIGKIGLHR